MQSIWNEITDGISKTRNIPVADLNNYANTIALRTPEDAVKYKFVDQLMYKDEVVEELKKRVGKATKDKLELVTVGKYENAPSKEKKSLSDPKIAVIYATGEIQSGEGNSSKIGSETLSEAIKEAREDEKVKAIVLRVNSPGGSALASEVIWREVYLANKVKPVVVSMGDVAASGGYYIAAAATKIYASPNTITGSIGVFGLILNTQKLLNNKLGITVDTVKTNAMANFGSSSRALTADEKNIMQQGVERVYDTFTNRVAAGRKISQGEVDSVGQGRVWSGKQASEIHLIDEFGGLKEAIAGAAKLAKLNKYRTIELPKQKDPLQEIMKQMTDDVEARYLSYKLGHEAKFVNKLQDILHMQGVQARMPFDVDLY
jgi:protease-4